MKKLLCALLACLLLTGCTPRPSSSSSDSSSSGSSASSADASLTVPPDSIEGVPIDFTWKPKVYSDYQRQGQGPEWGPEKEKLYNDCVDALMSGVETVPCPREELYWGLMPLLQTNFPLMYKLVCDLSYEDGQVHFVYKHSAEKREQIIREFADQIERHIEFSVRRDDTPTMAALALYYGFCGDLDYDHEAAEIEDPPDVTPYRALMTGEGICQSFGPAYAYLCMQLGINAAEATGTDTNWENPHSWTLLELNGRHYFADPTFDSGSESLGLMYFGMNSDRRLEEGGYPLDKVNVGFNLMMADELDVSDDRFAPLWEIRQVMEIIRTPEGMVVKGLSDRSGQDVIPVEDGKTITVIHVTDEELYGSDPYAGQGDLLGTAWMFAGGDLAFVEQGIVWIDSQSYTGPAQFLSYAGAGLWIETLEETWEVLVEGDDRLILRNENGDLPATRTDQSEFDRLARQYADGAL